MGVNFPIFRILILPKTKLVRLENKKLIRNLLHSEGISSGSLSEDPKALETAGLGGSGRDFLAGTLSLSCIPDDEAFELVDTFLVSLVLVFTILSSGEELLDFLRFLSKKIVKRRLLIQAELCFQINEDSPSRFLAALSC